MHTQPLNTHCLLYALLAISTSGTSGTSVLARTFMCVSLYVHVRVCLCAFRETYEGMQRDEAQ